MFKNILHVFHAKYKDFHVCKHVLACFLFEYACAIDARTKCMMKNDALRLRPEVLGRLFRRYTYAITKDKWHARLGKKNKWHITETNSTHLKFFWFQIQRPSLHSYARSLQGRRKDTFRWMERRIIIKGN